MTMNNKMIGQKWLGYEIAETEQLFREILEAQPGVIIVYDKDERVIFFSRSYATVFPDMISAMKIGAKLEDIMRFGISIGRYSNVGNTDAEKEAWLSNFLISQRALGPSRELELSDGQWLLLRERRSTSGHLVCTRTDITRLKRAEALANRRADEDPLTGLGNRAHLIRKLDGLHANRRSSDPVRACLLSLDVDHFKAVNDSLGHPAGDTLLIALATRIQKMLRKDDVAVRLGGDEFAILLTNASTPAQVTTFIQLLKSKLEAPVQYEGGTISPSLSIGAALYPDDGIDTGTIMRSSDTALYQAKRKGRNCYSFFDQTVAAALQRRAYLAEALRKAISSGEITLALQPQVRMMDRGHVGFEALARWNHNGATISPSEFIPVAEEMGLITPLGTHMFRLALGALCRLRRLNLKPGNVAVNVSAPQLLTEDFPNQIAKMLKEFGVAPQFLEIELTESTLLDRSTDKIAKVLKEIESMGISIALDDFGTGYASLAHLTRFPVHRLKIDKRFVDGVGSGAVGSSPIARTVIGLAHGLGMQVIAEGVETEGQFSYLKALGCEFVQGYLMGRPMLVSDAEAYLLAERHKIPPSIRLVSVPHQTVFAARAAAG